ncbi:uncharacterized protein Z519_01803 [Cladophialophora bantiana CBS 173.52]|uniref:C2H2-type domain-containing protein n=1 Tax=Cladophialophora bantiana (strain ATCC 10958 / CBS 173.52 / CDC B-1940 / NIH 8579) TaxID=1442370 RepID=A0A0D2IN47_CLAB1|nr:uncharacterized protein Z519_01803 [Cladophialophora bantiana CBS 173.52]KIW98219.1 hypothetical protein Z519_01803 [Cladophialophora bantiana CBS 173.52]
MDMLGPSFGNHMFPSFVPSCIDPSCAGPRFDSGPSTSHPDLYVPDQEQGAAAAFGIDSNGLDGFCALNSRDGRVFSQSWQVCYRSVPATTLRNAVTQPHITHTASSFAAWSPRCTSTTCYSSEASPSAGWDETGGHNYSTLMPGLLAQSDYSPAGETGHTPPEEPRLKKKRVRVPPVNCPVFDKILDKPALLREHMREHSDQVKCSRCDQTFPGAENLAIHMKMHEAGRHVCQSCSKVFSKRANYRRHLKCHDENRPKNKCPKKGCDKEYAFAGCLNRHIKSHYADYRCGDCDKQFNRADLRDRHQGKHCQKARERRAAEESSSLPPPVGRLEPLQDYQTHGLTQLCMPMQMQVQAQNLAMHQQPNTLTQGLTPEHPSQVPISTPAGVLQKPTVRMGQQLFVSGSRDGGYTGYGI